jgi:hypothetical protein
VDESAQGRTRLSVKPQDQRSIRGSVVLRSVAGNVDVPVRSACKSLYGRIVDEGIQKIRRELDKCADEGAGTAVIAEN